MHGSHLCAAMVGASLLASLLAAQPRITPITAVTLFTPAFFSKEEGWAIGPGPTLLRTTNGGLNWRPVVVHLKDTPTDAELHGTYFVSAQTAYVGITDSEDRLAIMPQLAVTRDGGQTWNWEQLPSANWVFESLFSFGDQNGPLWLGGEVSTEGDIPVEQADCPQNVRGVTWTPVVYYRAKPGAIWEMGELPVRNGCPVSKILFSDELHGVAIAGSKRPGQVNITRPSIGVSTFGPRQRARIFSACRFTPKATLLTTTSPRTFLQINRFTACLYRGVERRPVSSAAFPSRHCLTSWAALTSCHRTFAPSRRRSCAWIRPIHGLPPVRLQSELIPSTRWKCQ